MADKTDFMAAVLKRVGAPVTKGNLAFMYAWARAEGTSAAFNPLATTRNASGATRFNSVGVRNYPSFESGVKATADTIMGGYHAVVAMLKADHAAAIVNTPSGRVDLNRWVHGGGPDSSTSGYVRNVANGIGVAVAPNVGTGTDQPATESAAPTAPLAAPATAGDVAASPTPVPAALPPDQPDFQLGPQLAPPGTVQASGYQPTAVSQLWQQVASVENPSPDTLRIASLNA